MRAYVSGARPLNLEDLVRASDQLGDLVRQVNFKLAAEELVLRAERDEDRRRAGGAASGRQRRF